MGQGERRSVGVLLGAGIFIAPWLFVWLLLRRGHSMLSRGLGFGWFALLMVSTLNVIRHARDTAPQPVATAPIVATLAQPSGSRTFDSDAAPHLSLWTYENSKDEMRGSTDSHASLESVNGLSFGFPYNRGETRGRIELRKTARSGVDALLTITQGQFVCGFDGCSVSVKFDDGPVQKLWCNRTSDGDSTVLFVGDPKTFIARIKRARRVLVEAAFFQEGLQQLEFAPVGLVWKD